MKAILIAIKPRHNKNILNLIKWWEIRKLFPKDYVGWVYIYCTKNDYENVFGRKRKIYLCDMRGKTKSGFDFMTLIDNEVNEEYIKDNLNGKVIARFWCDKVEEMYYCDEEYLIPSCLTIHEMFDYLKDKSGKAIHITNLEVFDKPKEISEFYHYTTKRDNVKGIIHNYEELTRAPQSWCYIEV